MKKLLLALMLLLGPVSLASAQETVKACVPTGNGNSCQEVTASFPLPVFQAGSTAVNIATNTNTVIKASPGTFVGLVVNTAGTTSTATVYDNTACSGTVIGTFSTTAQAALNFGIAATTGICVTTAGGAAADITILYR
jgi:hypothetical protein